MSEGLILFVVGGILAISIIVALIAARANVPALVAFLCLGMILGAEGLGNIQFDNVELARFVGVIGLIVILFEGGLSTSRRRLREVFVPAALLSTVGVVATAGLVGIVAHIIFGLPWMFALLLGAVVSSTDAAAVFATLRFTEIRRRVARLLEAESGLNDPMAITLTVGFITWVQNPSYNKTDFALLLVHELGIGLVVGLLLGRIATMTFSRMPQSIGSFSTVASVAAALISYGLSDLVGGSGFLAVYLVGLAIGSTPSRYRGLLTMFHEGLAFLFQVAMFVILGLFVVPSDLLPIALPSIMLAIMVVAIRPLAVWLSIPFGYLTNDERLLVGWAGLRGAVPIVLGLYVLSAEIDHAELIFNTVFFVVVISTLIQGSSLNWVAKRLNLIDELPEEKKRPDAIEKIFFQVAPRHAIAGAHIYEIGLPPKANVAEIKRRSKKIKVTNMTIIKPGDRLCVEAPYSIHPEIEDVFMRWRRRV